MLRTVTVVCSRASSSARRLSLVSGTTRARVLSRRPCSAWPQGLVDLGHVAAQRPGVVHPADGLGVGDRLGQFGRCGAQQPGQFGGEPLHRGGGRVRAHRGRHDQVDQHADGHPEQRLADPVGGRGLGAADGQHQHGADRHLDQVRPQPHQLADHDRQRDQHAQAPPGQADHAGEQHGQQHPGGHADDALHPAGQAVLEGDLHDQQRGQRGQDRHGAGEQGQRGAERGHGRAGQAQSPGDGRTAAQAQSGHPHVHETTNGGGHARPAPFGVCGVATV
nr:hypothetical protein [Nakamurella multipartita]